MICQHTVSTTMKMTKMTTKKQKVKNQKIKNNKTIKISYNHNAPIPFFIYKKIETFITNKYNSTLSLNNTHKIIHQDQKMMNVSETIAFWNMKQMDVNKYAIFFNERFLNEIRFFSKIKSELYEIVFKMDEDLATKEDMNRAEECVCEMNVCLRSAHELYLHGQEINIDFKENPDLFMAERFIWNFAKGNYDKTHAELCEMLQEKILNSSEL